VVAVSLLCHSHYFCLFLCAFGGLEEDIFSMKKDIVLLEGSTCGR
jgi:hypothetical protein